MRARPRRHRAIAAVSGALALVLSLAACSPDKHVDIELPPQADAALAEDTVQQLQDAVTHAMGVTGSSGAIVGVWAPWSGSWVTGLGTQRPSGGGEVTADMTFRGGKITRAMTCDVLYAVAAEGEVALDDPISEYVAGVPDLDVVTLEHLCDGTSGIGSYSGQLMSMWLTNPQRKWDPRELASFGLGQPRASQAGAGYRDSDAGYLLLGLALERATGRSAASLISEYVVDPLDLAATRLGENDGELVLSGGQSLPGADGALNCAEPTDFTDMSASTGFTDSGIVTDIDDLGRYAQALATGALVPESEERFADPVALFGGAPSWLTAAGGAVQAGSLIGQFGMVPGYITGVFSDPSTGLTVAVVLNNSAAGGNVGADLAWELAAIASKAPATAGQTAPAAGLPWTAEQYHAAVAGAAVCTPPPAA